MASAYQAARQRAASINRSARGRILVRGNDRATYLQGLLTNDVVALKTGTGCYAAYLTPQGRMISDLWVYELGDVMLLALPSVATKNTVLAKLDQFIFTEDVQLGDVTGTFAQMAIVGPASASVVSALVSERADRLNGLPEHGCLRAAIAGDAAIVTRVTDTGEPGFDLYVEASRLAAIGTALTAAGVVELDADTADILRVEAGIPMFHRDMDEETIPLEAGIEARAINRNKGCYVGQEVIVRVLDRGHGRVAKKLEGLTIEDDAVPSRGAVITAGGKEVGTITSAVRSAGLNRTIALGYLQREFLAPGTAVDVAGHRASVTALPFVSRQ